MSPIAEEFFECLNDLKVEWPPNHQFNFDKEKSRANRHMLAGTFVEKPEYAAYPTAGAVIACNPGAVQIVERHRIKPGSHGEKEAHFVRISGKPFKELAYDNYAKPHLNFLLQAYAMASVSIPLPNKILAPTP